MSTFPSILEIGPGRGDFLFFLAGRYPNKRIAAIEYKRKRFDKLTARLKPYPNVDLHLGDAAEIVPNAFLDQRLESIYILYPDPWPKNRHAKNRLFQSSFLKEIHRCLKVGGNVFIATDDPKYRDQIQAVFGEFSGFIFSKDDPAEYPTFFADKWKKEGRSLYAFSYQKRDSALLTPRKENDLKQPDVNTTF